MTVPSLLIVTDAGLDPDDEVALACTAGLHRVGAVQLRAVVANLNPQVKRAQLAAGTLEQLGLADVPVAAGSPCLGNHRERPHEFAVPYLVPAERLHPDSRQLLADQLRSCEDGAAVLLLISGLTDAARLLADQPQLCARKLRAAAIMGGLADAGTLEPDSASNNRFDPASARYTYRRLAELGVRTVVLSRHAAYQAAVAPQFYERLAAGGHPVAVRLRDMQHASMDGWWHACNLPAGDPRRGSMPERCDRAWFLREFCGIDDADVDRDGESSVWDLVCRLCLYDPLTLLAVCEPDWFAACPAAGTVAMIGADGGRPAVRDIPAVHRRLEALLTEAFT